MAYDGALTVYNGVSVATCPKMNEAFMKVLKWLNGGANNNIFILNKFFDILNFLILGTTFEPF